MHCREFEARLQELLDDRLALRDDAALAEHAAGCESCRAGVAMLADALATLTSLPVPQPRADLQRRIATAVDEAMGSPVRPASRVASFATVAARYAPWIAAACVLPAAYFAWKITALPEPTPPVASIPQQPAGSIPANVVVAVPSVEAPVVASSAESETSWSELASAAGHSYASLAADVGRDLRGAWEVAALAPSKVDSSPETSAEASRWIDDVGEHLKPLADSTVDTLHLFRSLIPADAATRS